MEILKANPIQPERVLLESPNAEENTSKQLKIHKPNATIEATTNPSDLILKVTTDNINLEMETNIPLSNDVRSATAESTAKNIISLANKVVGDIRLNESSLPTEQKTSNEETMKNIKQSIDKGFSNSREVLDGLSALTPNNEITMSQTETYVREGLSDLAELLGVDPNNQKKY